MRIRSTKPEFWRSRRIAAVSWDARLVLKGLESYVDDNGVGKDDIALIVGDIFSRDMFASPRETVARVSEAISELNQAGLVWRYEADGTHLLYIAWWESIQRIDKPGKGRLPRPDGTFEYGDSQIRESVASPRESVAPGTGEQGNRGTGEQGKEPLSKTGTKSSAGEHPLFEAFWNAYAHKVGRGQAVVAFKSASKKVDPAVLIEAAAQHADWHRREGTMWKKIPHASTWLNGERWMDERPDPGAQSRPTSAAEQRMAANAALTMQLRAEEATQLRAIEGNR